MGDAEEFRIKVKPILQKAERGKLPTRISSDYPAGIPVVFFSEKALESLRIFAASDTSYELGGVLVGKVAKASRRLSVEVHDFIPATKGVSRRASFEFTNEAQQEIHEVMEQKFKHLRNVGWFHTHPGYGIFLSSADQFIDDHYFVEKHHIAVVLDPTKPGVEVGVFVWEKEKQRRRVQFFQM